MDDPDFVGPFQGAALWLEQRWGQDHLQVAIWLDRARRSRGDELMYEMKGARHAVFIQARKDGRFALRVKAVQWPA